MNSQHWEALRREYEARGFSFVPLDGKEPPRGARKGWQQRYSGEKAVEMLAANPGLNVGLLCGVGRGLVVLDFDNVSLGEKFSADLISTGGPTATVKTGREGGRGRHFYFKPPAGCQSFRGGPFEWEGRTAGELRGEGCYICAPPSLHVGADGRPTGFVYDFLVPLDNLREWTPEVAEVAERYGAKQKAENPTGVARESRPPVGGQQEFPFPKSIPRRAGRRCLELIEASRFQEPGREVKLWVYWRALIAGRESKGWSLERLRELNGRCLNRAGGPGPLSEAELNAKIISRPVFFPSCAELVQTFSINQSYCEACGFPKRGRAKMITTRDVFRIAQGGYSAAATRVLFAFDAGVVSPSASQATIAEGLKMSRSTVNGALQELKKAGVDVQPPGK